MSRQKRQPGIPVPKGSPRPDRRELSWHTNKGYWFKCHEGGQVYLGRGTYDEAFARWEVKLHGATSALTMGELGELWIKRTAQKMELGRNRAVSLMTYRSWTRIVVGAFGEETLVKEITPSNCMDALLEFAKGRSQNTQHNLVRAARIMFSLAYQDGLIDKPVQTGTEFMNMKRMARRERGTYSFTLEEIRALVEAVRVPTYEDTKGATRFWAPWVKPVYLLAINAGVNQTDLAMMRRQDFQMEGLWAHYDGYRHKTNNPRVFPLWDETRDALLEYWEEHPPTLSHPDDGHFAFTSVEGTSPLVGGRLKTGHGSDLITSSFVHVERAAGVRHVRGRGFRRIRNTFITLANEEHPSPVNLICGLSDGTIQGWYNDVSKMGMDRLRQVTETVRGKVIRSGQAS